MSIEKTPANLNGTVMTTYKLGQVIYVVLKKETRVYPMQVVEILSKQTLEGELTSYMVRGGTDPKTQLLISDIDGEIFDSSEKAKRKLTERATASIDHLIDVAVTKAKEWYPGSFEASSDDSLASLKKAPGPSPAHTPTKHDRNHKVDPVAELQEELRREANVESPLMTLPDDIQVKVKSTLMTLPDGTQVKVKSVKLPDPLQ